MAKLSESDIILARDKALNFEKYYKPLYLGYIEQFKIAEEDEQKRNELFTICKFICSLNDDVKIIKIEEKPDFLLKVNDELIGVEHTSMVIQKNRNTSGMFHKLVTKAEEHFKLNFENQKPFQFKNKNPKRIYPLVSIEIKKDFHVSKKNIDSLAEELSGLVFNHLKQGRNTMTYNNFTIDIEQNNKTLFYYNPGVNYIVDIQERQLQDIISRKDKKYGVYIENIRNWRTELNNSSNNNTGKMWLVIESQDGVNDTYGIADFIKETKIESKFDRIYIFNMASNEHHEILS